MTTGEQARTTSYTANELLDSAMLSPNPLTESSPTHPPTHSLTHPLTLLPKLILRFISSSGSPSADGREPLSFVCRSSSCAARSSHCWVAAATFSYSAARTCGVVS